MQRERERFRVPRELQRERERERGEKQLRNHEQCAKYTGISRGEDGVQQQWEDDWDDDDVINDFSVIDNL